MDTYHIIECHIQTSSSGYCKSTKNVFQERLFTMAQTDSFREYLFVKIYVLFTTYYLILTLTHSWSATFNNSQQEFDSISWNCMHDTLDILTVVYRLRCEYICFKINLRTILYRMAKICCFKVNVVEKMTIYLRICLFYVQKCLE